MRLESTSYGSCWTWFQRERTFVFRLAHGWHAWLTRFRRVCDRSLFWPRLSTPSWPWTTATCSGIGSCSWITASILSGGNNRPRYQVSRWRMYRMCCGGKRMVSRGYGYEMHSRLFLRPTSDHAKLFREADRLCGWYAFRFHLQKRLPLHTLQILLLFFPDIVAQYLEDRELSFIFGQV